MTELQARIWRSVLKMGFEVPPQRNYCLNISNAQTLILRITLLLYCKKMENAFGYN